MKTTTTVKKTNPLRTLSAFEKAAGLLKIKKTEVKKEFVKSRTTWNARQK